MIWVILLAFLGFAVLGVWLISEDHDTSGGIAAAVGVIGSITAFIVAIILMVYCSNAVVIDEKIAMYTEENTKIEQQMADAITAYQKYETDIFTNVKSESAVTLVSMYPELKSDTLVQAQLEVYIDNNEKIKELKSEKISASVVRWWTYFGR